MKNLKDYIIESRRQISDIQGNLGEVLSKHSDELNRIKNQTGIDEFLKSIYDELNDSAKKYLDEEVKPTIKKMGGNYIKSYHYLYNIYLAGYTDSRLGVRK